MKLEPFTTIEKFHDFFFDDRYCERYLKLFERFANNRSNLKLACIIAHLKALQDQCVYLVYTGTYTDEKRTDAGYCLRALNDNLKLSVEEIENIKLSTQYSVFNSIKAYVVNEQGNVLRFLDFDEHVYKR